MHRTFGLRQIGLAATAAVAVGLATTGSAGATPPTGSSSVGSDTLTVMGTSGADQLALRLAPGDPNTLQVDFGDDGSVDQSFSRSTFSRIDVFPLYRRVLDSGQGAELEVEYRADGLEGWQEAAPFDRVLLMGSVKELPLALLLAPIGFDTLATEIWDAASSGFYARAAAPAALLLALSVATVAVLLRAEERAR